MKDAIFELEAATKGLQNEKDSEEENNESNTENSGSDTVPDVKIIKQTGIINSSNNKDSDARSVKIVAPLFSSFEKVIFSSFFICKEIEIHSQDKHKKKANYKAGNPLLKCVQELVDTQPTPDLCNLIFAYCRDTLIGLQEIEKRDHALAKLCSDNDYIPTLIRYNPTLSFPKGLVMDQDTINAKAYFKCVVLKSQLKLAGIIKEEA